ncbi:MAG TPA: hypothetical protein VNM90_17120 [Haliangium sp.]|nr:hypothetical protein [Haliangium sp.]
MVSQGPAYDRNLPSSTRTRTAALAIAGIAVGYALLSVWYFYEDFFKYLQAGAIMTTDRSGWMVSVDYPYLWSILSPWRMVGAALTVALLGVSARSLWHARPRARALSLLTMWGVLLPQVFWYTEFALDWHQGAYLADVVLGSLVLVAVPSVLLYAGPATLSDWNPAPGSLRLLALAVSMCWLSFGATEFLDHSYQLMSWGAYTGAFAAVFLGALAAYGLFGLRTWALWLGVGAGLALALVPLTAASSSYLASGGYMDDIRLATTGSDTRVALSMILPLAVVWFLGAPYLHGFVRRLRG